MTREETEDTTEMIPGLDIIGKGYDVFGRFAHPSGVINQKIFNDFADINTEAVVGGVTY